MKAATCAYGRTGAKAATQSRAILSSCLVDSINARLERGDGAGTDRLEPGFAVIGHIEDLRGNVTRGFCPFSKISRRGILPKVRHTDLDILIEIIVMIR